MSGRMSWHRVSALNHPTRPAPSSPAHRHHQHHQHSKDNCSFHTRAVMGQPSAPTRHDVAYQRLQPVRDAL